MGGSPANISASWQATSFVATAASAATKATAVGIFCVFL
jgi:hypothetical protein